MTLHESAAITCAKEFTIKAIEHNLISASDDATITAKNVTAFFNSVADTLSENQKT